MGVSIRKLTLTDAVRCRTVWNPDGKMVAKYRTMHLFDIDIPGQSGDGNRRMAWPYPGPPSRH